MNIMRNLPNFEPETAQYSNIELRKTHPLHLKKDGGPEGIFEAREVKSGTFGSMVLDALGQTNNQIMDSQLLQQQAIVSPDSVDPSTVVVSMLKADMSLSLTKAVIDRATTAFKELTTIR
ncbi:flagellar hook-basal body complex protein FliE [Candidatus Haliotispira prima]|uniref:Flagellar hook-basal body complex protein FliE n=1 Tax=Candidatus Haliotispira prima TaxID=3034016 RepID=A0ABY8MG09_9SPIO|nr:flagellar hook-basal body complex protein FliE [Candidatus Haliotispira prima]